MFRGGIGIALAAVLLAGCGAAATTPPTLAPTPAPEASAGDRTTTVTSDSSGMPFELAAGDYSVLWSAEDCALGSFAAWLVKPSAPTDVSDAPLLASGLGASRMRGDMLATGVAAGRYLIEAEDDCKSWTLTLAPFVAVPTQAPTPMPPPRADVAAEITDTIDTLMCAAAYSPPGWCRYLKKDGLYDVELAEGILTVMTSIPDTIEGYPLANELCNFLGRAHYDSEGVDLGYHGVSIEGVEFGLADCPTTDPP